MYVGRIVRPGLIFQFAWRNLLIFTFISGTVFVLYTYLGCKFMAVPFLPIGVIGTAVAFYIGFKNNSSYERLWEARRIWGSLTNNSRTWALMALDFVTNDFSSDPQPEPLLQHQRRLLIYRQLAFITALRHQLRRNSTWQMHHDTARDVAHGAAERYHGNLRDELLTFLPEEEVTHVLAQNNSATHLLRRQSEQVRQLRQGGYIDDFRHMEMMRMLGDMYNQQGACERIKSFPLPRQYAFFSAVFVWLFVVLLPFGLLGEFAKLGAQFSWLMIPFHVIISWVFLTMEIIGDSSENPFENGINDVPMTAICRNIEIDLRQLLTETEVPLRVEAVDGILL